MRAQAKLQSLEDAYKWLFRWKQFAWNGANGRGIQAGEQQVFKYLDANLRRHDRGRGCVFLWPHDDMPVCPSWLERGVDSMGGQHEFFEDKPWLVKIIFDSVVVRAHLKGPAAGAMASAFTSHTPFLSLTSDM